MLGSILVSRGLLTLLESNWLQAPGLRIISNKTYYVEGAVVVVLFGLAVFAVGRASRRG